jgi:hypothetical protein
VSSGAKLTVGVGSAIGTLEVSGSFISNGGTIILSGGAADATLIISTSLSLSGGGTISLTDSDNNFIRAGAQPATLTNVDNTISGAGQFGYGDLAFVNQQSGTIDATGTINPLWINAPESGTNAGLIEDTGAGGLQIYRTTIIGTGSGTIAANGAGATVQLVGATLSGGTLSTISSGLIETFGSGNVMSGIVNHGAILVEDASTLTLQGSIGNSGTITVSGNTDKTYLGIGSGGATLTGSGTINLSDSPNNFVTQQASGVTLTNVNNTISGGGTLLGQTMTLVNSGVIAATDSANSLTLNPGSSIVNDGTLVASGGMLVVDGPVSGSGTQIITNGGTLVLVSGSSEDTVFDSGGGGGNETLQIDSPYSGTISGFSHNGDVIDIANLPSGLPFSNQGPIFVPLVTGGPFATSVGGYSIFESGNLLEVVEDGTAYNLQLDP